MYKICSTCKKSKLCDKDNFAEQKLGKFGFTAQCKECKHLYDSSFRKRNKERIKKEKQIYYLSKKEFINQRNKIYYFLNKEERNKHNRNYLLEHLENFRKYKREYEKNRRRNDPYYKFRCYISNNVFRTLKNNNGTKNGSSVWMHLPYTPQQFREHLEKLFDKWMFWNNYGAASIKKRTWQIDHIMPQSKLPYDSFDHPNFLKCWSLENLRPLDSIENIIKGDSII